jgi:folylpolyglutamate synthase/dihydropteroate synthase
MQVNGSLISEEDFVAHLPRVMKLCAEHEIPATLFELTFILSCLYFESAGCEAVVLEVS